MLLSFHNTKTIALLTLFIILGVLNVVHSGILKEKSVKNLQMEDTFNEMSKLFISMNDLLIGEVIKFSDKEAYSTKLSNEIRISQALDELSNNRFQQKVFDLFPKNLSDFILYSSYCRSSLNP